MKKKYKTANTNKKKKQMTGADIDVNRMARMRVQYE